MKTKRRKTLAKLLTAEALRTFAGAAAYERGVAYFESGKVVEISYSDETLIAKVAGTRLYDVTMWVRAGRVQYSCNCEAAVEGAFCKHCVAAGLAMTHRSIETS